MKCMENGVFVFYFVPFEIIRFYFADFCIYELDINNKPIKGTLNQMVLSRLRQSVELHLKIQKITQEILKPYLSIRG